MLADRHCSISLETSTDSGSMSQSPIFLFVNPTAGRGRATKCVPNICRIMQQHAVQYEIITSNKQGDIEAGVRQIVGSGCERIVVAGGDGSVHEAVNGILQSGKKTGLGVIPIGTGNDFAKAVDVPLQYRKATAQLAKRISAGKPPQTIDAGRMNDRYFANGAGIGFDAKINRIARSIRLPIGSLVYLLAVFQGIRDGLLTPSVRLRYADQQKNGPVLLANVSNGPWLGGIFHIAPMAQANDGQLDLILVDSMKKRRVLSLLYALIKGRHLRASEVSWAPVDSFELDSDQPLPSHLDGEVQPLQTSFRIEIIRGALSVL